MARRHSRRCRIDPSASLSITSLRTELMTATYNRSHNPLAFTMTDLTCAWPLRAMFSLASHFTYAYDYHGPAECIIRVVGAQLQASER